MTRRSGRFVLTVLMSLFSALTTHAAESSFQPIPAYSPEAEAVRKAAALRLQGDRLQEQGRGEEAREAWQSAIEAYRQAGFSVGEVEVYFQIAISHQADMIARPEDALQKTIAAMAKGTAVLGEFLDGVLRTAGNSDADSEAAALLSQASDLAQMGDCSRALPLFEAAGQRYAVADSGNGKVHALAGRLRCQNFDDQDPTSFIKVLSLLQEVGVIAQEFQGKVSAGPALRYLRAVESAELGKLQEAETLLRLVITEFEAAGDTAGTNQAALELGCVLLQAGKLDDAVPPLKLAREGFANREDPASQRNFAAAEENLAKLSAEVARVPQEEPELTPPPALQIITTVATPAPAEEPLPREPKGLSPTARARRRAVFMLGEGDRLRTEGDIAAARVKWQSAAEAYQQADEPLGSAEAYQRLSDSYATSSLTNPDERWLVIEYYTKNLSAAADAHETFARREMPLDTEVLSQADALRQKATHHIESGLCLQALPLLEKARQEYGRAGLAIGEVRSLMLKVSCLAEAGDFLGASMILPEALSIMGTLPKGSANAKLSLAAQDLFQQGRWREAKGLFQELLCREETEQNPARIAQALLDYSKLQVATGDYQEAELSVQRALGFLPFADPINGEANEALAHQRLGSIYLSTGRIEQGSTEMEKARELWMRAGYPDQEVGVLRDLGIGLAESGDFAAALSSYKQATELQSLLPYKPEMDGDLLSLKGWIDFQQGNFQEALGSFYEADRVYRENGVAWKAAGITSMVAGINDFLGRHEEALEASDRVKSTKNQSASSFPAQISHLITVVNLLRTEKYHQAEELISQLLPSLENGDPSITATMRSFLGMSLLVTGKTEQAQKELEGAAEAFAQTKSPTGSTQFLPTWTSIATKMQKAIQDLEDDAERDPAKYNPMSHSQVVAFLDSLGEIFREQIRSRDTHQGPPGPFNEFELQHLKLLERYISQDPEGSLREMGKALNSIENWGKNLTLGGLKSSFFGQFARFYSIGVEISQAANQPDLAFSYSEQMRARAFVDQIGAQKVDAPSNADPSLVREERRLRLHLGSLGKALADEQRRPLSVQDTDLIGNLQNNRNEAAKEYEEVLLRLRTTAPEYASLISVDTLSAEEVQGLLDDKTTLIEYFLPESPLSSGSSQPLAWVIDRDGFIMKPLPVPVQDLRNRVTLFRNLIESREPVESLAEELYSQLFAPLAPHIRHRNLIIVPHGVLHFLPFAALRNGRKYLGDAYALSYSPSATALKFAREKKAAARGPILALGNPDGSLQHAPAEARAAARRYGSEPLLGSAATEGAVLSRAGEAGILHLAAHAVLNPVNPLFTRIELAPDETHDGRLEMQEVFSLDLSNTGLVVLSACRTQLGRLTAGDEIEGLTRAFLYAGTPTVMSSLWAVQDESTAFLMDRFYHHLHQGKGRAESLRRAQKETRRRHPHPYHWAAFVLTGDGR